MDAPTPMEGNGMDKNRLEFRSKYAEIALDMIVEWF
jgi:hypothetical protein